MQLCVYMVFKRKIILQGEIDFISGFSNVWIYAALWFAIGFVQGGGWPGCANIMRHVSLWL